MITSAPKLENRSLYEVLKMQGQEDCDITDTIYDWGANLGYGGYDSFEEIDKHYKDNPVEGAYYKFILLCCWNIKVEKPQPDWYTICHVCEFIDENREAFDTFMNEENREGFRPMDYDHKIGIEDSDELFYDVYLTTFENLINGNYADSDYEKLIGYLLKK